jgi:hypothetical protein
MSCYVRYHPFFTDQLSVFWSVTDSITTLKSLILRRNPIILVAQPQFLSLISASQMVDRNVINVAHSIFQTGHDSLILLNGEEISERLNRLTHLQSRYLDSLRNKYFGNDLNYSRTLKWKEIRCCSQESIS